MFVLPGADISSFIESKLPAASSEPPKIHVGPGIIQTDNGVMALRAGNLHSNAPRNTKFTLTGGRNGRYLPIQNDLVIGIVTAKLGDLFRVDIGGPQPATLPLLTGFEGATKKSRPSWPVGTVIFARVSGAHPDLEPELACFDPSGNIPNEVFGELCSTSTSTTGTSNAGTSNAGTSNAGTSNTSTSASTASTSTAGTNNDQSTAALPYGQLLRTSCPFSRSLQSPLSQPLLKELGSKWTFELAAGANGRVFVAGASATEVAHICRVLEESSNNGKIE